MSGRQSPSAVSVVFRRVGPLALSVLALGSPGLAATLLAPVGGGTYQSVIVDWPQGQTGTVQLSAADTDVLVEGSVDATGKFSIALPGSEVVTPKLAYVKDLFVETSFYRAPEEHCHGIGTASPTTARFKEYNLLVLQDGKVLGPLKLVSTPRQPAPVGQRFSHLNYFDTATTLDGTVSCDAYIRKFKGTFPAGWSLPSGTVNSVNAAGIPTSTLTSATPPATVTWHLYDEIVGIGIGVDTDTPGPSGFVLSRVTADAPAAQAGVMAGDILVQVNGQDVSTLDWNRVVPLIRGEAGTTVTLGIRRGTSPDLLQIMVKRQVIRVI